MPDPLVVQTLSEKRAEILGRIAAYEAQIAQAKHDLAHVNATIRLFTEPQNQQARYLVSHGFVKKGEIAEFCALHLGASGEMTARELALRFEDAGAAAIIPTDIDRDGMLGGVNVEATRELALALATPVIASGGVASLDDLVALKAAQDDGIEGTILGRALYDGRIDPAAALELAAAP